MQCPSQTWSPLNFLPGSVLFTSYPSLPSGYSLRIDHLFWKHLNSWPNFINSPTIPSHILA